ncbi:sodium/calcium exchanger 2-like [Xiphias gladius]|uniref:sodium/calcium exchanger 2-like n=1 Tax=Xiphias gladius TaxID=8245 RepID=UPI001A99AB7C|nr:sodium/calcium exchanger 2-like [Xiphias gladius]
MSLFASPVPIPLLVLLLLLPLPPCQPESQRSEPSSDPNPRVVSPSIFPSSFPPSMSYGNNTVSGNKGKCEEATVCRPGILLPVWQPNWPGLGDQVARAVVYFVSLMYMFLGVSIIADRFMASIEVITSQVCGHNLEAGELGPGTIVGSAAFNMFVILGICVWVIPNGETRKIKHLRVFFITAFWSIFAYIWLYLILSVMSPGVVEVRQTKCGLEEERQNEENCSSVQSTQMQREHK